MSLFIPDVDDGSTVTDFLPAERARGITIQSAAVTLHWPPLDSATPSKGVLPRSQIPHTINLIDTPGHADFTFEVLRSLRILDGAVCILDGVAGVEAQTEQVWTQANKYSIPRIIFVNKLDRDGAAFERTVKEVGTRLRGWPAICQIPWWEGGKGRFTGIGDAINLTGLEWGGGDGKTIQNFTLEQLKEKDSGLREEVVKARIALVEALCEFDEELLSTWLEHSDDALQVPAQAIKDSLRRCIIDGSGRLIPVFAGASFRNIGVQPLLDAVDDYLPDPTERPDPRVSLGSQECSLTDLLRGNISLAESMDKRMAKKANSSKALVAQIESCALAFKVVNDARRGVLVYIRVYSGSIKRNASIWNTNLHITERAQRLLQMQANDAVELQHIPAGQIGVIAGLKHARTGDTLVAWSGHHIKTGPPSPLNMLQLRPIDVPPPVFFAAIEPDSLSEVRNVKEILQVLLREDPSLHVNMDEDSGQILLSGMGELHLEIARDRLVNDFKAKATMGNIEISYRECVLAATTPIQVIYDREVAGKKSKAACEASIEPFDELAPPRTSYTIERDGNHISLNILGSIASDGPLGSSSLPANLPIPTIHTALINGAVAALARGPHRNFPVHASHVTLTLDPTTDFFGPSTTPSSISSAAHLAVKSTLESALQGNGIGLMEPVMNVVISCNEVSLGPIIHDISSARGGHVLSLENEGNEISSTLPVIDSKRIYAPPDPFASTGSGDSSEGPGQQRQVTARVPLKEMVGYLKHLRSLTGGRGTFIMTVHQFERLSGPREKAV
ncbi:putative ribosome-releasing factor 2, mitochondrial [Amylocarpus encephaloides]|uniref:Ribosome-releasing factor 2, mitochondrial n=1 Tax=Amylocarpus encephaloides TaxID=45428 RepID=A0A9P7YB73_9HELO|nr:putative ribosome-releasing factor 2, mitochondrial [Amylocarpus encephaloides]